MSTGFAIEYNDAVLGEMATMVIKAVCSACRRVSEFDDELAGETMSCTCGQSLQLTRGEVLELELAEEPILLADYQRPSIAVRIFRSLLGQTLLERVARLSLYSLLLAAAIIAPLEYLAQSRWEAAYQRLDGVVRGAAFASGKRMDLRDNVRDWMSERFGLEPDKHRLHDLYRFDGVVRKYWIVVRYNPAYQMDGVARNHGWSYPQAGDDLPWKEDPERLSGAGSRSFDFRQRPGDEE